MLISLVFESIFEFLTAVGLDRVVILSTSGWSAYDVGHLMLVAPGGDQGVCCHPSLNQPLSGDHWIDLNSWGGFGIIITIVALITINRMLLTDARPSLVQPASIHLSRLLATVARQVRTPSAPPGQNYSLLCGEHFSRLNTKDLTQNSIISHFSQQTLVVCLLGPHRHLCSKNVPFCLIQICHPMCFEDGIWVILVDSLPALVW